MAEAVASEEDTTGEKHNVRDVLNSSMSFFEDERKASWAWVAYIGFYWTMVYWLPTLILQKFLTSDPGLYMFCVGVLGFFAMAGCIKAGLYPSGAIEGKEGDYTGRGRWAALILVCCIALDTVLIAMAAMADEIPVVMYIRAGLHCTSLLWASLFYFNRFRTANPSVAWQVFWAEWFDIVFTMSVIFFLHNSVGDGDGCFSHGVCVTYFVFFIIQVFGWLVPMISIKGWGGSKDAKIVSVHLACLDFLSDFPIVIAVVSTGAYAKHPIVFVDCIYKSVGFVRSVSYYMVYYVWLGKGLLGRLKKPGTATTTTGGTTTKQPTT